MAIEDPKLLEAEPKMEINISFDDDENSITIADTGVGMTEDDLVNNLGTIAKTGTTDYMEAIKGGDINIIGQFGVGFYSSFLVAKTVEVTSKNVNDEEHIWTSSAASGFTITKPEKPKLTRGTSIKLILKSDQDHFLSQDELKKLIKKYSEFINFPINLYLSKQKEVEVTETEEEKSNEENEEEKKKEDDDIEEVEKPKEKPKKTKKVKKTEWNWETVNDNKAIWMRDKK